MKDGLVISLLLIISVMVFMSFSESFTQSNNESFPVVINTPIPTSFQEASQNQVPEVIVTNYALMTTQELEKLYLDSGRVLPDNWFVMSDDIHRKFLLQKVP